MRNGCEVKNIIIESNIIKRNGRLMLADQLIGDKRDETCKHFSPQADFVAINLFKQLPEVLQNLMLLFGSLPCLEGL